MIRVVLDTNILVSAAVIRGNEFELLMRAQRGEYEMVLSMDMLIEFEDVISRKKFGFAEEFTESAADEVASIASFVNPKHRFNVISEDPADNRVLECAVAGKADYIVSGDSHLLNLREFKGIKIIKAKNLLEILKK
jgi:putative PIN family toxin of toxin-antitoxin system